MWTCLTCGAHFEAIEREMRKYILKENVDIGRIHHEMLDLFH